VHELSIALSIIDLAQEQAARRGAKGTTVHLRLGALAGVVKTALVSSYEMACEDTLLQGSQLIVEGNPVVVYCWRCQMRRPLSSIQVGRT
jgi:hydrogenase nickel incorporation protein HypA/HybF